METKIRCEACGGALARQADGAFVCQTCGAVCSAETVRKEEIYQQAFRTMRGIRNAEMQQRAIELFKTIPGWRDADERIAVCERRIPEIRAKEEADRAAEALAAKRRRRKTAITLSVLAASAAFAVLCFTVLLPALRWSRAMALYDAGRFEEAIPAFEAMDGYRDSRTMIRDCEYGMAEALLTVGDYEAAIPAFEAMEGYRESAAKIRACREAILERDYAAAMELCRAGNYREAYPALLALQGYRDTAETAAEIYEDYKLAALQNPKVGSYLVFGAYEQDNDPSDGKEDIEWLVLDRDGDFVLIISRYVLDFQQYNANRAPVSWETCTLKTWLNNSFFHEAFSAEEQAAVRGDAPGNATGDRVFLLNQSELYKYFPSDESRRCAPTDYAIARGVRTSSRFQADGRDTCWWWLRWHVVSDFNAPCVNIDGCVYHLDLDLWLAYDGVRPAIWIKIQ